MERHEIEARFVLQDVIAEGAAPSNWFDEEAAGQIDLFGWQRDHFFFGPHLWSSQFAVGEVAAERMDGGKLLGRELHRRFEGLPGDERDHRLDVNLGSRNRAVRRCWGSAGGAARLCQRFFPLGSFGIEFVEGHVLRQRLGIEAAV